MRPIFIIYFSALNIIAFGGLIISIWSNWAISDETRKSKSQIFRNMNQKKMKHIVGLMFSIEGGLLASETLLLAKSGVKLFTLSIQSQVNQFNDNTSRFILLALLVTAILQVYLYFIIYVSFITTHCFQNIGLLFKYCIKIIFIRRGSTCILWYLYCSWFS